MRVDRLLKRFDMTLIRASRRARKGAAGLGPGLITGVADDDPSGISTYTVAGAKFGYQLLWMSLVTLPMNIAVQSICARIGLVTGKGLAGVIGARFGRRLLAPVVALLVIANVVNIGADIGAIAAAIELITHVPAIALVAPLGVAIALVEIVVPYPRFAHALKLLTLVIFAYVVSAFFTHPDWGAAGRATVVPRIAISGEMIAVVVAILGTTISPYLFFWQASEEVEEEVAHHFDPRRASHRRVAALLHVAHVDVATGMALANVGFYFVVLTAAAALFSTGQTEVATAAQAAEALRPFAGDASSWLFALGIIGTGLLAIPVLAGSAAYATSELFGWPEGLNDTFRQAPQFYGVIALATLLGVVLNFLGVSELRALFVSAVLNGVIAPVLLAVIMLVARDRRTLGEFTAGAGLLVVGWATTAAMGAAALALLLTL